MKRRHCAERCHPLVPKTPRKRAPRHEPFGADTSQASAENDAMSKIRSSGDGMRLTLAATSCPTPPAKAPPGRTNAGAETHRDQGTRRTRLRAAGEAQVSPTLLPQQGVRIRC